VEAEGSNEEKGFIVTGSVNLAFVPPISWLGPSNKYGINPSRNLGTLKMNARPLVYGDELAGAEAKVEMTHKNWQAAIPPFPLFG